MKSILKWVLCLVIIIGLIPIMAAVDSSIDDEAWASSYRRRRTLIMQRRILRPSGELLECDAVSPDTFCDDFSSTGACPGSSSENKCRETWDGEDEVGTGWTYIGNSGNMHSGTCDNTEPHVYLDVASSDCDTDVACIYEDFGSIANFYIYFQFYVSDLSGLDANTESNNMLYVRDSSDANAFGLYLYNDNGTVKLWLYDLQNYTDVGTKGSGTIAASTWYEIVINWNTTANTAYVRLATLGGAWQNGDATGKVISDSGLGISRDPDEIFIGVGCTGSRSCTDGDNLRFNYTAIMIDDGNEVIGCD